MAQPPQQPQVTYNCSIPLPFMQNNFPQNIQTKPINNSTIIPPNVQNCGYSNIQKTVGRIVENLNYQIHNENIDLVINLKTIDKIDKQNLKSALNSIKFIEKLIIDGYLNKDENKNIVLDNQEIRENNKEMKDKNSEQNIALQIIKMNNEQNMDEVKNLKNKIQKKNEEIDELNCTIDEFNRLNLFLKRNEEKQKEIKKELVAILENYFKNSLYLDIEEKSIMAKSLDISVDRVNEWFECERKHELAIYQTINGNESNSEINEFDLLDGENGKEKDNDEIEMNE